MREQQAEQRGSRRAYSRPVVRSEHVRVMPVVEMSGGVGVCDPTVPESC